MKTARPAFTTITSYTQVFNSKFLKELQLGSVIQTEDRYSTCAHIAAARESVMPARFELLESSFRRPLFIHLSSGWRLSGRVRKEDAAFRRP